MKKSELLEYNLEAPDWLVSRINLERVSLVREKDEEAGLMLYKFYRREDIGIGEYQPYFVIFKDKHTWINYYPQERRWTKGSLENTYDYYLYGWGEVLRNLRKWQKKILEKRYKARKKAEAESTKVVMSYVPELPEDFRTFCEEEVMKTANYLIYSTKRGKVYCTHCKQEYDLKDLISRNNRKPRHGYNAMCDRCKVEVQQLSEGMSRRGKYFGRYAEIMQNHKDGIVIRRFNIFRDFNESLTPETHIRECRRYVYDNRYEKKYEKRFDGKWHKINNCFTTITYYAGRVYTKNRNAVIKKSIYRERGLLEYLKETETREIGTVLKNVAEYPCLEQIRKAGLSELTSAIIGGRIHRLSVDQKETKLTKILKINKEQLRILRNHKRQYDILCLFQKANEKGVYISEIEVDVYEQSGCNYSEERFLLETNLNKKKVCTYILEQEIGIRDFVDHIELLKKCGLPLKKEWLYPKNFEQAHQEEIEMDIMQNDKVPAELSKKFKKTYGRWRKIAEKVTMDDGTYQIVFPADCKDIKVEGKRLHHCVGNYVERAANGKTVILFMRSISEPEKRLYTMEYCAGKLVQIRASCNGAPVEQARKFAENFAAEFAKAEKAYITKEKKQKAAV